MVLLWTRGPRQCDRSTRRAPCSGGRQAAWTAEKPLGGTAADFVPGDLFLSVLLYADAPFCYVGGRLVEEASPGVMSRAITLAGSRRTENNQK